MYSSWVSWRVNSELELHQYEKEISSLFLLDQEVQICETEGVGGPLSSHRVRISIIRVCGTNTQRKEKIRKLERQKNWSHI